jgi:adenylate kinase
MRLLLIGPPGAGKGTQAQKLSAHWNIPHISTGDILRDAIRNGTPVGARAQFFVESGGLVPDDVMIQIVLERLCQPDVEKGFILDGFPRTDAQAAVLIEALKAMNKSIQKAVVLKCPDMVIIDRICGRRICPQCNTSYHIIHQSPQIIGICDKDGTTLTQREDDMESRIAKRLAKYYNALDSITKHFSAILRDIDANQSPDRVFNQIVGSY